MKTLDVNNLGVQEMKAEEMRESNGGYNPLLWEFVLGYVLIEAALNPTAHIAAFKAGWNSI